MDIRKLQKAVTSALEDIKAEDIAVFDVTHLTPEFDRVIVASAHSARQTKALATHVQEKAKKAGAGICRMEGEDSGEWILVDLGDIVVHVMQPSVRAHYNLEELWNHPRPKPVPKVSAGSATKIGSEPKTGAETRTRARTTPGTKTEITAKPKAKAAPTTRAAPSVKLRPAKATEPRSGPSRKPAAKRAARKAAS